MTWETATVRLRTWARMLVRVAGLLLVLAGAYHLFAPYVAPTLPQWAPWRVVGLTVASPERGPSTSVTWSWWPPGPSSRGLCSLLAVDVPALFDATRSPSAFDPTRVRLEEPDGARDTIAVVPSIPQGSVWKARRPPPARTGTTLQPHKGPSGRLEQFERGGVLASLQPHKGPSGSSRTYRWVGD